MPTSEAPHLSGADPLLLLAACALLGLAVGLGVYLAVTALGTAPGTGSAVIGDVHRRARRERVGHATPAMAAALSLMPIVLPLTRRLPLDSLKATLAERYAQAGWPGGLDDDEVFGIALLVGFVFALPVTLMLLLVQPIAAPLGLAMLAFGPGLASVSLASRAAHRKLEISRTLPYVMDLLVVTMRAGASFTVALEQIAKDYARHPLGVEIGAVLTDIRLGLSAHDAFGNLARRVPMDLIRMLVDEVNLSQELGRPLADALESFADRLRIRRVQDAVETAGRAKVMVLVPGMLILFASLIILFSPFIVRAYYGGFAALGSE